jgi:uncharacterized protein YecE (DUF72 family)
VATTTRGEIRIGCSGWQYRSWKGRFYPAGSKPSEWLGHYVEQFDTVEINRTFYRLPEAATFRAWRQATPPNFLVTVKASRYLTHLRRLRDPDAPLDRLFTRARALGPKLGPVLYQLPGNLQYDEARLRTFLDALPRSRAPRHVIEFRHPSWYRKEVFEWLRRAKVAVCLHDKAGSTLTEGPVEPFVYIRFHGTGGHYHGSYDDRALQAWARRIVRWSEAGVKVFAYFNNDPDATAPRNALTLKAHVSAAAKSTIRGGA